MSQHPSVSWTISAHVLQSVLFSVRDMDEMVNEGRSAVKSGLGNWRWSKTFKTQSSKDDPSPSLTSTDFKTSLEAVSLLWNIINLELQGCCIVCLNLLCKMLTWLHGWRKRRWTNSFYWSGCNVRLAEGKPVGWDLKPLNEVLCFCNKNT